MWPATSSPWKATCQSSGWNSGDPTNRSKLSSDRSALALAPVLGEGLGARLPDAPDQARVGRVDRADREPVGQRQVGDALEVRPGQLAEAPNDPVAGGLQERPRTRIAPVGVRGGDGRVARRAGAASDSAERRVCQASRARRCRAADGRVDHADRFERPGPVVPVGPVDPPVGDQPAVDLGGHEVLSDVAVREVGVVDVEPLGADDLDPPVGPADGRVERGHRGMVGRPR